MKSILSLLKLMSMITTFYVLFYHTDEVIRLSTQFFSWSSQNIIDLISMIIRNLTN